MSDKDTFIKLYADLQSIKEINKDLLLRIFLEFIIELDFNEIDFKRSRFIRKNDGYSFNLFSVDDRKCVLFLEVLNNIEVDIQLNQGGEFLYLQPINNWSDVGKLRNSLKDLFCHHINEELVICDGKIKSVSYTVDYNFEGGFKNKYSSVFGSCWFWQKKVIEKKTYEPWIDDARFG